MTAAACSLSADELAEQLERYRAIGRLAAAVEHEPGRIVVRFANDPPSALIDRALEVERGCCPFFEIDYDPVAGRLAIRADHPDRRPGFDAIAHALTESRATVLLPDGAQGEMRTVPDAASCCSPAALETCCEPQDKQDCCGQPANGGTSIAAPSRCGCRKTASSSSAAVIPPPGVARGDVDTRVQVTVERADAEVSLELQQAFFSDIASRYPGWEPASSQPVNPSDLAPPNGIWLVAYRDGPAIGCGGLQRLDAETGEVRRIFLDQTERGRGTGRRLLVELEEHARRYGYRRVRLTTGDRQLEALRMFQTAGYEDILPFTDGFFTRHWMEKAL